MRTLQLALIVCVVLTGTTWAQAENDSFLSLTINGADGPGPITLKTFAPGTLDLLIEGTPTVPFAIAYASGLDVGSIIAGPVSVDIGPGPQFLMNGISPVNFIDFLAFIDGDGSTEFSLELPSGLLPGLFVAAQAIAVDVTAPMGVSDSAATEIILFPPFDYGSINYLRGNSLPDLAGFQVEDGLGVTASTQISTDLAPQPLFQARYSQFVAPDRTDPEWQRSSLSSGPKTIRRNEQIRSISTIHGELIHFRDDTFALPAVYGFGLFPNDGGEPHVVPDSLFETFGASSPFEPQVAISSDQSTMAVVYNGQNGAGDRILMVRLDGSIFPLSGLGSIEVSPFVGGSDFQASSLRFVGDYLYFVSGPSAQGTLYSAPRDGSASASAVILPMTGTGTAATLTHFQLLAHRPSDRLFLQAGPNASNEDVYVIDHAGLPGNQNVINSTSFSAATGIQAFGDAYDGLDGRFAVEPDGDRFAFVTTAGGAPADLFHADTAGGVAPTNLTPDTDFDAAFDSFIDLRMPSLSQVTAFLGPTTTTTDLYQFNLLGGPPTNLTATSGDTSAPFSASPAGSIDCDGSFLIGQRFIFIRDGIQSLGASAGASVFNIVGANLATSTVYDILGDEFGSPVTVFGSNFVGHEFDFTFSRNLNDVMFRTQVNNIGSADQIYSARVFFNAAAVALSNFPGTTGTIDNMVFRGDGQELLFTRNLSGDEELYRATTFQPTSTEVLVTDGIANTRFGAGSVHYVGGDGPFDAGYIYAVGTTTTDNPTDAKLMIVDPFSGVPSELDSTAGLYSVINISMP